MDLHDEPAAHDYYWHQDKTWALLCPCGYGSLNKKLFREHIVDFHKSTIDVREYGLDPYWWAGLPAYKSMNICADCTLVSPIAPYFKAHNCANHKGCPAKPAEPVWRTHLGRKFTPYKPAEAGLPENRPPTPDEIPEYRKITVNTTTNEEVLLVVSEAEGDEDEHDADVSVEMETDDEDDDGGNFKRAEKERSKNVQQPSGKVSFPGWKPDDRAGKSGGSKKPPQPTAREEQIDAATGALLLKKRKTVTTPPPPKKKFTALDPSDFPVYVESLETHGFTELPKKIGSYSGYKESICQGRNIAQRGFLTGQSLDYPAIISVGSPLVADSYIITDKQGFIVADMVTCVHASMKSHEMREPRYCTFNPVKWDLTADIWSCLNVPFSVTHHVSLNKLPRVGEYRATRNNVELHRYETVKVWFDNARVKKPRVPEEVEPSKRQKSKK